MIKFRAGDSVLFFITSLYVSHHAWVCGHVKEVVVIWVICTLLNVAHMYFMKMHNERSAGYYAELKRKIEKKAGRL